jgi:hypothetical protein
MTSPARQSHAAKPIEKTPRRTPRTQRVVAARMAERRFVRAVMSHEPTLDEVRRADELVRITRQAKTATFLDQYRLAA